MNINLIANIVALIIDIWILLGLVIILIGKWKDFSAQADRIWVSIVFFPIQLFPFSFMALLGQFCSLDPKLQTQFKIWPVLGIVSMFVLFPGMFFVLASDD